MFKKSHYIELFINTWISDSGELFDFNTKEATEHYNFKASLYKLPVPKNLTSNHYYFIHQPIAKDQKTQFLIERRTALSSKFDFADRSARNYQLIGCFRVFLKQENDHRKKCKCYIQIIDTSDVSIKKGEKEKEEQKVEKQRAYLIVRTFDGGYPLKQNQIIKLAKLQFRIQELSVIPSIFQVKQDQVFYMNQSFSETKHQTGQITENEEGKRCKICYDPDLPNNPLVSPCNCKGQIAYIHVDCLKHWIDTKVKKFKQTEQDNSQVYNIKELFCQICKKRLPKKIVHRGEEYMMLTFLEDYQPYITLKSGGDTETNSNQLAFLTIPKNKKTSLGRMEDNGMILFQNSVSRKHAVINLDQQRNCFILEDTNSKYGTLIYEKNASFKVSGLKMRAIEIGNTIFGFKLQEEYN